MQAISKDCTIRRVHGAEGAGQTNIDTGSVDARPYDSVTFIVTLGAITTGGVVKVKAQGRKEYDSGSWVTLDGEAAFTSADGTDNRQLVLEVRRPVWSELRAHVERDEENVAIESVVAICSAPQNRPAAIGPDVEDRTIVLGGVEA